MHFATETGSQRPLFVGKFLGLFYITRRYHFQRYRSETKLCEYFSLKHGIFFHSDYSSILLKPFYFIRRAVRFSMSKKSNNRIP